MWGCARTITTKLSELEDISEVMVDVNSGTVSFETNSVTATQRLRDTLKAMGYPTVDSKMVWEIRPNPFLAVLREG